MSFKKLSLMVCCINNNKKTQKKKETTTNDDDNIKNPSKQNLEIPKQVSLQGRFSLADFSNPSSSVSLSDLSNSFLVDLYIFTVKDLELITQGFSKSNFIGEGGFGEVYKGFIDDKINPRLKAQPVAVKAMKQDRSQGHQEWLAEVILLGQLKHPHLVNLIGYCCEDEHRLLVYEYMERGNLMQDMLEPSLG